MTISLLFALPFLLLFIACHFPSNFHWAMIVKASLILTFSQRSWPFPDLWVQDLGLRLTLRTDIPSPSTRTLFILKGKQSRLLFMGQMMYHIELQSISRWRSQQQGAEGTSQRHYWCQGNGTSVLSCPENVFPEIFAWEWAWHFWHCKGRCGTGVLSEETAGSSLLQSALKCCEIP